MSNVSIVHVFNKKFEILCNILSKMFNKNVELDLIRLHYPYNNSNILVNLLAMLLKKLKFRRITRRLFRKMVIKSIKKYFINNKTTKIIPSVKDNVQYNNEGNSMNKYNIIKSALPAFLTGLHIKVGGRVINLSMKSRKTVNIVERGSSSIVMEYLRESSSKSLRRSFHKSKVRVRRSSSFWPAAHLRRPCTLTIWYLPPVA